jgi:acetolactate decarboxylase
MNKYIFPIIYLLFLVSCNPSPRDNDQNRENLVEPNAKSDAFYHYSIWWAFVNLVFDGTLKAGELKKKGDIALGSYNALVGELVMVDGILYRIAGDGSVHVAEDEELICYANATWFDVDKKYSLPGPLGYDSLRSDLRLNFPSLNQFYGIKIHGEFQYMKCGGVPEQEKPYTMGLDELLPARPVFEGQDIAGTMVGFYCPDFIGNINVAGFHFHFISDDASFGGHVMEFDGRDLKVELDFITQYTFVLPETPEYLKKGTFEKEFQYGTK